MTQMLQQWLRQMKRLTDLSKTKSTKQTTIIIQTNKQKDRQPNKQANKQTNKHTNKKVSKQISRSKMKHL